MFFFLFYLPQCNVTLTNLECCWAFLLNCNQEMSFSLRFVFHYMQVTPVPFPPPSVSLFSSGAKQIPLVHCQMHVVSCVICCAHPALVQISTPVCSIQACSASPCSVTAHSLPSHPIFNLISCQCRIYSGNGRSYTKEA